MKSAVRETDDGHTSPKGLKDDTSLVALIINQCKMVYLNTTGEKKKMKMTEMTETDTNKGTVQMSQ